MKDTIIKGDGTSRKIKAPANIPESYAEWRNQLLQGTATLDMVLNEEGCTVFGTALNKESLLRDKTANALELPSNPTVDDALYALSQKEVAAEVRIAGDIGTTVTMTRNNKSLSAKVASNGYATVYPAELGEWVIVYTYNGTQKTKAYTLEVIGIVVLDHFALAESMNELSWSDIDTCASLGRAQEVFKVGDSKTVKIDGTNYDVRIIGFNHDVRASDGSNASITFQLVDCLESTASMGKNGSETKWSESDMRTRMSTYFGQLPSDLQAAVKVVTKITNNGCEASSGTESTEDKLFLLSEFEVFGATTYAVRDEGLQYEFYKAGNTKIKKVNGSPEIWWLRSPIATNSNPFCCIESTGEASNRIYSQKHGVSFAFCI